MPGVDENEALAWGAIEVAYREITIARMEPDARVRANRLSVAQIVLSATTTVWGDAVKAQFANLTPGSLA